jgi:hypothetical protein
MLSVLENRTYRHLFAAQIIALLATGLATVALGLLAYDMAGNNASEVLGTAFAIKMIAYVGIAPIATAFVERLPRRFMLVSLDLVRAACSAGFAFRERDMANICVGFYAPIGFGCVHTDFPGDDPNNTA